MGANRRARGSRSSCTLEPTVARIGANRYAHGSRPLRTWEPTTRLNHMHWACCCTCAGRRQLLGPRAVGVGIGGLFDDGTTSVTLFDEAGPGLRGSQV